METALSAKISAISDTQSIILSPPQRVPDRAFIGRQEELRLCKAAFGIDENNKLSDKMKALHFRLEGPPGVGKNEIVYQLARDLAKAENMPFYSIQGHEEMTPEDLSILVVPDPDQGGELPLRLRASPLATALMEGGLFFFDEINRVPERALSPLASVLDDRRSLYSAMTGITIEPNEKARSRFRFCCALNPSLGHAGAGTLPDYISERTLPALTIGFLQHDDLKKIISENITEDAAIVSAFEKWYALKTKRELSVRRAQAIVTWAINSRGPDEDALQAMKRAEVDILQAKTPN
jgi:MoxR-like ATPase